MPRHSTRCRKRYGVCVCVCVKKCSTFAAENDECFKLKNKRD